MIIDLLNGVFSDQNNQRVFGEVFTVDDGQEAVTTPGERVQVTNQSLDTWGMFGTVKLTDRHGVVWVRLDGYGAKQFLPFEVDDLITGRPASPLAYDDEPTQNPYVNDAP